MCVCVCVCVCVSFPGASLDIVFQPYCACAANSSLYSWGSRGLLNEDVALDRNDPNYMSESEKEEEFGNQAPMSQDAGDVAVDQDMYSGEEEKNGFRLRAAAIVKEYYLSGNVDEVAIALTDEDSTVMNYIFVKKAIVMSLDRGAREKEMTSQLLSSLYGEVLSPAAIRRGFHEIFLAADDVLIDVPGCIDDLSRFTARASCDDIISPAFVTELIETYGAQIPTNGNGAGGSMPAPSSSAAAEIVSRTLSMLSSRFKAEELQRCWGVGASSELSNVRQSIDTMIVEFLVSNDVEEACTCLRELRMPFFHHEVVKRLLMAVLAASGTEEARTKELIARLVSVFAERAVVSSTQLVKGFMRVAQQLDDITLDAPHAPERFDAMRDIAAREGWLEY